MSALYRLQCTIKGKWHDVLVFPAHRVADVQRAAHQLAGLARDVEDWRIVGAGDQQPVLHLLRAGAHIWEGVKS